MYTITIKNIETVGGLMSEITIISKTDKTTLIIEEEHVDRVLNALSKKGIDNFISKYNTLLQKTTKIK